MAIPQSFIQELLARADVVEIVGRYVQLKKGGANFMGLCPFHGEKSPSFTVEPGQTVLPLLRLRQERQCHRLPDGPRRHDLYRSGQRPRPVNSAWWCPKKTAAARTAPAPRPSAKSRTP